MVRERAVITNRKSYMQYWFTDYNLYDDGTPIFQVQYLQSYRTHSTNKATHNRKSSESLRPQTSTQSFKVTHIVSNIWLSLKHKRCDRHQEWTIEHTHYTRDLLKNDPSHLPEPSTEYLQIYTTNNCYRKIQINSICRARLHL